VLDRATDAERQVQVRFDDLAGLSDLLAVRDPTGIDGGAGRPDRAVELLRPFGELVPGTPQGAAVRLESDGGEELANIIRAFDQAGVKVANLELHEASLNDVFLTKTGRSLEGAQREAEEGETGEQPALEGAAA